MEKISIYKRIDVFLKSLYNTLRFIILRYKEYRRYGSYEFPYREDMIGQRAFVLANGPSLKEELPMLINDETFLASSKFALNFFSATESYKLVKPDKYCLADKGFFIENTMEGHRKTISALNKDTSWELKLFVPYTYYSVAKNLINNPHITIFPISTLMFEGFEKKRYKYYKQGKAVPSFVNVTLMIEYLLLNMGCKDIRLYGVDHTFFNNMAVDEENHVCLVENHYYGNEYRILRRFDGSYFSMCEWLMDKYLTFKEHERIRGYADYLGAQIVNCTKGSLIDAYVRLSQIEKEQ